MSRIGTIARRTFLFGSLAIAGGVAFGAWYVSRPAPNPLKPGDGETSLNPFVMITAEGVTLVAPRAEMGQGVRTTWAALLAEEMDLDLDAVTVIHGPAGAAYYNSAMMGGMTAGKGYDQSAFRRSLGEALGTLGKVFEMQVTGGSTSMRDGYERMRVAGAGAREVLKMAAADRLGVDIALLHTEAGHVVAPDGTRLPYTQLAAAAAQFEPPDIVLRPRSEWRLLGKSLPRVDMVGKATGTATFGMDVRLPGMKFAALKINPHLGGGIGQMDATAARLMPGVLDVVTLKRGFAVVAENTWQAMQAAEAVEVEWLDAGHPADMAGIEARLDAAFDGEANSTLRDDGNVNDVPAGATAVEAEYFVPYLAHATMEPMNATALIDGDGLTVWCGNQAPTFVRDHCADAAGIDPARVEVITTYMGGGFGRRSELDFSVYATQVAKTMPGTPVQLTWSREEDMTHDFVRQIAMARLRGTVRDGRVETLDLGIAMPAVMASQLSRQGLSAAGPDNQIVAGAWDQPFAIPNQRVTGYRAPELAPISSWRSVGASSNGFFYNAALDELIAAAGADPMAERLRLCSDPLARKVLEAVAEMSDWSGPKPGSGRGRGVALTKSFGVHCAQVVEVSDTADGIRIDRVWVAAEVGTVLDPVNFDNLVKGGVIFGLAHAMNCEITYTDGIADQTNFHAFEGMRLYQCPDITVRGLENGGKVLGIGEPPVPPAAPALAGAIFAATGTRLREMPFNKFVDFA